MTIFKGYSVSGGAVWRMLAVACLAAVLVTPGAAQTDDPPVLARVDLAADAGQLGLPVYAMLQDAWGQDYALVIAPRSQLDGAGRPYQVLDADSRGQAYVIGRQRGAALHAGGLPAGLTLHDDGRQVIARAASPQADALVELGFDLRRLPDVPEVWQAVVTAVAAPAALTADPLVAEMIGAVTQDTLYSYTGGLSGEWPVVIGGSPYTIATRYTASGTPIAQATQYVYEHLAALGLATSYHYWTQGSFSGRNVIAERVGLARPNEIVLVMAHLDDTSSVAQRMTHAPGADDNASGSAGVLVAADILSGHWFERTVRFVFFTGEEQGLYGSKAYAAAVAAAAENVVAAYNADMIAWDSVGGPTLRLHTRVASHPGHSADLAIAQLFGDVLAAYGLSASLTPIITPDGIVYSDHSPFWNQGYPAILAIEDDYDDFNPNYHSAADTLATLNLAYFTSFVKATVGTAAHLAQPLAPLAADIGRAEAGAVLSWAHCCSGFVRYEVYRATVPYLPPAAAGSVRVAEVSPPEVGSTATFTDVEAFAAAPAAYFYRVVGVAAGEQRYTRSTEQGVFNFALGAVADHVGEAGRIRGDQPGVGAQGQPDDG